MKKTNNVLSRIFIIAGVALLLAACGFFVYNKIFDYRAGLRAQELLDQMMLDFNWDLPPLVSMTPAVPAVTAAPGSLDNVTSGVSPNVPSAEQEGFLPHENSETPTEEDITTTEEGTAAPDSSSTWTASHLTYSVIGIISIPKLGVRLPVLGECTNELLSISCCRLSGLVTDRPIRLVIAGHNISSHFKGIDGLQLGDEIAFTTVDGTTYFYGVTEISAVHKTGGSDVLGADGWDLTLLTCKDDRTMRAMVRCAIIGG